jgi:hypothetical protein
MGVHAFWHHVVKREIREKRGRGLVITCCQPACSHLNPTRPRAPAHPISPSCPSPTSLIILSRHLPPWTHAHGRHSPPFSLPSVRMRPASCRRLPAPLPLSQTRSRTLPSSDAPRNPPIVTAHAGIGLATVATSPRHSGGLGPGGGHGRVFT